MNAAATYCKNCGEPTAHNYCSRCGQRTTIGRVTFSETFRDLASTLFSFEGPLWRTLILLFSNPGRIFREFLSGKRKKYYKPIPFFILTTIIYVFIRSTIGFDALKDVAPYQNDGFDSTMLVEAGRFMFRNINNFLFLFVFTLAAFLKLFFYSKYSFAEFIAISFYLVGVYTLIGWFNTVFMKYIAPGTQYMAMLAMVIYINYAMVSLFRSGPLVVILKTLFSYILGFLLYVAVSFGFSIIITITR